MGPKFNPVKVKKDPPVPAKLIGSVTVRTGPSYVKPLGLVPTSCPTVKTVAGLPVPMAGPHPTTELEVHIVVVQRDRPNWAVRVKSRPAKFEPEIAMNVCKSREHVLVPYAAGAAAGAFWGDQNVNIGESNVKRMIDVPTSISVVSAGGIERVRNESVETHRKSVFADHADV
jgi:hypothetical protein